MSNYMSLICQIFDAFFDGFTLPIGSYICIYEKKPGTQAFNWCNFFWKIFFRYCEPIFLSFFRAKKSIFFTFFCFCSKNMVFDPNLIFRPMIELNSAWKKNQTSKKSPRLFLWFFKSICQNMSKYVICIDILPEW